MRLLKGALPILVTHRIAGQLRRDGALERFEIPMACEGIEQPGPGDGLLQSECIDGNRKTRRQRWGQCRNDPVLPHHAPLGFELHVIGVLRTAEYARRHLPDVDPNDAVYERGVENLVGLDGCSLELATRRPHHDELLCRRRPSRSLKHRVDGTVIILSVKPSPSRPATPAAQEGPAPRRAFDWWRIRGFVHQETVTSFEHVLVPASHTLYVALPPPLPSGPSR